MSGLVILVLFFCVGNVVWWQIVDRQLRALPLAVAWRALMLVFTLAVIAYAIVLAAWPMLTRDSASPIPINVHVFAYLWNFIAMPAALGLTCLFHFGRWFKKRLFIDDSPAKDLTREPASASSISAPAPRVAEPVSAVNPPAAASGIQTPLLWKPPTRRQMLAAMAMALPPVATGAVTLGTMKTMYGSRIRRFELRSALLPYQLEGMTIAHVSDTHIGKFLHPDRLPAITETINNLDADFIAFTGDLIDLTLSDLKHGIPFLHSLKSRCGMVVCEGNHDLIDDRGDFEQNMREADLQLLIGEQLVLPFHSRSGKSYPIQFLGTPWNSTDAAMAYAIDFIRPQMHPDAFPILLAHHPHSFDAAAEAGIPLILSGHTHGGQVMLTRDFGVGSIRFRYTSGLYQKLSSNLIVNNGLGNWFPLRINAPTEIVHITLKGMG